MIKRLYIAYAMLVLRLGVKSAFFDKDSTCNKTAPELYQTSPIFISLSVAAWGTVIFGYLIPFCCAFILITRKNDTTTASWAITNATRETYTQDNNLIILLHLPLRTILQQMVLWIELYWLHQLQQLLLLTQDNFHSHLLQHVFQIMNCYIT